MTIADKLRLDGWVDLYNGNVKHLIDYLFLETDKYRFEFNNNDLYVFNIPYTNGLFINNVTYEQIQIIVKTLKTI